MRAESAREISLSCAARSLTEGAAGAADCEDMASPR
jgi:hypothetical protein